MACVEVSEWNPEQVAEWMRGLDDALIPYGHFFLNNAITGRHLLLLAADDLPNLHITKLGHQELILEAVELLRHFHYSLSTENLQCLSLKLSSKALSLYNALRSHSSEVDADGKQERVTTPVLSTVADILISVKSMVSWLDRSPFEGQEQYAVIRNLLLHISIELATNALRDRFAEKPIDVIKSCSKRLSELCDNIIKESKDPMIIQPASVDVATIKKKPDDELGMYIRSSYSGIHHIGQVKYQSPAHLCGRVEEGDEVVQVNYQTVVGWQLKKLVMIMRENPTEIILTLKKRPRHANMFGQPFLRPFTFSSNKHTAYFDRIEWPRQVSPQFDVSIGPANHQSSTKALPEEEEEEEEEEEDDSAFLAEAPEISSPTSIVNLFIPRPRSAVQRRATVTGASPQSTRPPVSIDQLWRQVKREQVMRSMSHDPSKFLAERPVVADAVRRLKASTQTHKEEDVENNGDIDNVDEVEPSLKERSPMSPPRSALRPQTCIGTDPQTEARALVQGISVAERGIPTEPTQTDKSPSSQKSDPGKDSTHPPAVVTKSGSNTLPRTLTTNHTAFSSTDNASTVPKVIITCADSSAKSTTISTSQNIKAPAAPRKESVPLREKLRELDNAVRASLQNLVGDTILKSKPAAEPEIRQTDVTTTVTAPVSASPSPAPAIVKDGQPPQSYQVIIAGGVPQVSASIRKDSAKASKEESPVLRRKAKAWEFANRRVSCKDLGMGDCQGWLHRRREHKGLLTGPRWVKRWCVLKNHNFYCYKDKDDLKAESLMYLPGFNVSPATETKTKKHAFKVYHSGAAFFYASDSQQDMSKWMNKMGLAAISYDATSAVTTSGFTRPERTMGVENVYYSETEDEDLESVLGGKETSTPNTLSTANSLMSVNSGLDSSLPNAEGTIAPSNSCPNFTPQSNSDPGNLPKANGLTSSPKMCRNANTLPKYSPGAARRTSGPIIFADSEPADQAQVNIGASACYQKSQPHSSTMTHREARKISADSILLDPRPGDIHRSKRKSSFPSTKGFFREKVPISTNISSISLRSVRTQSSSSTSPLISPSFDSAQEENGTPTRSFSLKLLDGKVAPNTRIASSAERRYTKFGSTDNVHLDKLPPTVTLAPAFEMNLDSQQQPDQPTISRRQSENSNRFSRTALQLVRSPNILKKFATSPRGGDSKRPSRKTMWFDQETDFSPGSSSTVSSEEALDAYPKYATCGSQTELRGLTRGRGYSSSKQQEARNFGTWTRDKNVRLTDTASQRQKAATWDTRYSRSSDVVWEKRRVESLASAWRHISLSGREPHFKTKVTVRISDIPEKSSDEAESPRLPLKPAMGVSMIGKHRRSSNISDKMSEPGSPLLAPTLTQGTQTDTDDEDDLALLCDTLHYARLTIDGTHVDVRRKNTMIRPHSNKRQSQQLLLLRALHRTLKARQQELDAINELLSCEVTTERLNDWLEANPGVFQADQSSSEVNESD